MKKRVPIILAALSTAAILFFTLRPGGDAKIALGWSFTLTSGPAALAELIQNLILFTPLGVSLTLAGVRPVRVVAIGALLSFTVEFLQQWIPGRDPSVGDIICNTTSTALGVLLVVAGPLWLWAPARRSAWQARATALIVVLVWYGTGAMVRQSFPPPPYRIFTTPDLAFLGHYEGEVLKITRGLGSLEVRAVAAPSPPGRTSPLVAALDPNDARVLLLSVDGPDLTLRYDMPAVHWTLEQPDLRLRGAMKPVAPRDTFTAATWHDSTNICLRVNATESCHLGYTIGDGWKLIYYPEGRPPWTLGLINTLWIFGCVVGVGFWAARGRDKAAANNDGGEGRRDEAAAKGVGGLLAMGLVIAGLLMVPLLSGLKPTPIYEWIGALGGMAMGYWAGHGSRARNYAPDRPVQL